VSHTVPGAGTCARLSRPRRKVQDRVCRIARRTAVENQLIRDRLRIDAAGDDIPPPIPAFAQLRLPEASLRALAEEGITTPTPIQTQGLPVILAGRDCVGISYTGSGKTLVFVLPMLMLALQVRAAARSCGGCRLHSREALPARDPRLGYALGRAGCRGAAVVHRGEHAQHRIMAVAGLHGVGASTDAHRGQCSPWLREQEEWRMPLASGEGPLGIVICPSRELARQTYNIAVRHSEALAAAGWPQLRHILCVGGEDAKGAFEQLRCGAHTAICTPGRLKDFLEKRRMNLDLCRYLCLDEADRMVRAATLRALLCHALLRHCCCRHCRDDAPARMRRKQRQPCSRKAPCALAACLCAAGAVCCDVAVRWTCGRSSHSSAASGRL
jgi:DEAD/DEAH box helicase